MIDMKKYLAALLVLILALSCAVLPVSAEKAGVSVLRATVLGDSIASGYGLENSSDSYGYIIASEKKYSLHNNAVPGHKTTDMLALMKENDTVRSNVESSDLLIISIGGNDLLGLLQNGTSAQLFDIMLNGADSATVKNAIALMKSNLDALMSEIRFLNPDCVVIFQTQYNPIYAHPQYSSYAPTLDKLAPVFNSLFFDLAKNNSGVYVTDIFTAFGSYYKETGKYDIIQSDGIHPSVSGHALIAEIILGTIGELEKAGVLPSQPVIPEKVLFLLGDANSDSKVNISDATTIQKSVAGLVTLEDAAHFSADTDFDTKITVKDATQVQKHLAGLLTDSLIGSMLELKQS